MKATLEDRYSIDRNNFTVTKTTLQPIGFKNGEVIVKQITKKYESVSYQDAESIISLLKSGVEIK